MGGNIFHDGLIGNRTSFKYHVAKLALRLFMSVSFGALLHVFPASSLLCTPLSAAV